MAAEGITTRHTKACRAREGGRCNCTPSYQAHIWDDANKRRLRKTFPTQAAAKGWRIDVQRTLRSGGSTEKPATPTLAEYAGDWLEGARDGTIANGRGALYKPSSLRSYERALRLRVLPKLGRFRLHEIERNDVQDLADRMAAEGLTRSTINNTIDPLRAMYRRAVRRKLVTSNPTTDIELRATGKKRDRIADPEEAARLIAALPVDERAVWATAMYAGLRSGELRALKWSDIDLAGGVIRVERGWDDVEGEIEGKTQSARRSVPVPASLRIILTEHRNRRGWTAGALVFGATPTTPFYRSTVRARALRTWKAAGLEPIGLHECRHTFASLMIHAGVNAKALSSWMGHASVTITFDRYGHLMPGGEAEGAAMLDSYLDRVQKPHLAAVEG